MSDGCRCEYLSEECGGADVVCQHCYDKAQAAIKRLRAALSDIEKFGHGEGHGCGYTCATMAKDALSANSVLCVNDRMTACEECGEEWPAGDHERWRLVNGQQVCAKCAKEAEPKREADAPPAAKPRRMKANPRVPAGSQHAVEHDKVATCSEWAKCEPVDAPEKTP